jgi:hypothetical protein
VCNGGDRDGDNGDRIEQGIRIGETEEEHCPGGLSVTVRRHLSEPSEGYLANAQPEENGNNESSIERPTGTLSVGGK